MEMNVTAYCFGIGTVDAARYTEALIKAKGFLAVSDHQPGSLAAIFETENDAKVARNLLEFSGAIVSQNVIECRVNSEEIKAVKEKNKR